jgi:hypothetical protein
MDKYKGQRRLIFPPLPTSPQPRNAVLDTHNMTELHDNTPVFCTAEIPTSVLNDFFQKANNAPEFAAEGVDDASSSTQPISQPLPARRNPLSLNRHRFHF